jgi:sec-independent protein translocase protein TatA
MGALSPTHWLIIIGVVVVLFGAKRLPDAARSLGRSARILKAEVKEIHGDDAATEEPKAPTASRSVQQAASQPAAAQPTVAHPSEH